MEKGSKLDMIKEHLGKSGNALRRKAPEFIEHLTRKYSLDAILEKEKLRGDNMPMIPSFIAGKR